MHTLTFEFDATVEAVMFNPAISTSHGPEPMVQINITFVLRTVTRVTHPLLMQSLAQLASVDLG